jgi:hypothetical protein
MIILHGTSLRRWEQIRTHGFSVAADPENLGIALPNHVSFGNLALAGYHAEFRAYWDNYPSQRDKANPPVVLALDVSDLQDHLQVDPAAVKMPFENLLGATRQDLQARWAGLVGYFWRCRLARPAHRIFGLLASSSDWLS